MEVYVDLTQDLIERMDNLAAHYDDSGDRYRGASFTKASRIFAAMSKVGWIFAEKHDVEGIDGIGPSSLEEALLVMDGKPSPRMPAPTPAPIDKGSLSSMAKLLLRIPTFDEARAAMVAQTYRSLGDFASSMDARPMDRPFLEHINQVPRRLKPEVARPLVERLRIMLRGHVNCIVRGHYMDVVVFSDNTRTYGTLEITTVIADGITTHLLHRGASESWFVHCLPELTILFKVAVAPSRDRAARELSRKLKPAQWLAAQDHANKLGVSLLPGSIRREGRPLLTEEADELCAKLSSLVL